MLSFVDRLKQIKNTMREKKKPQHEVSAALGYSQSWLSQQITGYKQITMLELLKILKEVEHPLEDVFPDIQDQLEEILQLLSKGAQQDATVNLINLLELQKHYGKADQNTEATV